MSPRALSRLILPSLLLMVTACGDKDDGTGTGSGGSGDEGGEEGGEEGGGETGDEGGGEDLSCTVLGTLPVTMEAGSVGDLEVYLHCDDTEEGLRTNFALLLGGVQTSSSCVEEDDEDLGAIKVCFSDVTVDEALLGLTELELEYDDEVISGSTRIYHFIDDWQGEVAYETVTHWGLSQVPASGWLGDLDDDGEPELYGLIEDGGALVLVQSGPAGILSEVTVADTPTLEGGSGLFRNPDATTAAFDAAYIVWDGSSLGTSSTIEVSVVPISGLTLSDIENKKLRPSYDAYGFTPLSIVDVAVVGLSEAADGSTDVDILSLVAGTVKGGSPAWALHDSRDDSLSIIQDVGRYTSSDTVQLGLVAGPKDTAAPDEPLNGDEVLLWAAAQTAKDSTAPWTVYVATQGRGFTEGSELYEDSFSESVNPLFEAGAMGDATGDGLGELVLTVASEGVAFVGVFPATDGQSFGSPLWITTDPDHEVEEGSAVHLARGPVLWMKPGSTRLSVRSDGSGSELGLTLALQRHEGGYTRLLGLSTVLSSSSFSSDRAEVEGFIVEGWQWGPAEGGAASSSLVYGGGATHSPVKDPSSGSLEEGELVSVGQGRPGGPVVLTRGSHPDACPTLGVCGTVLVDLGDNGQIELHEDGSVTLGDTDLSDYISPLDALYLDEQGVAQVGKSVIIRKEVQEQKQKMQVVVVDDGEVLGEVGITNDFGEGFTAGDFGVANSRGEVVLFGGTGNVEDLRVVTSSADGVAVAQLPVSVFIDRAGTTEATVVPNADGMVDLFNSSASTFSVSPPNGSRALGATLSSEGHWMRSFIRQSQIMEGADQAPDLVLVVPYATGTDCPWATVLIAGGALDAAMAELTVLATADEADCSDLEVPMLTADLLGTGSQQLVTARADGDDTILKVYAIQEGELLGGGEVRLEGVATGASVSASFGVSASASILSGGDLNGDGLQDLYVAATVSSLGGAGVLLSDGGRFVEFPEPVAVGFEATTKGMVGSSRGASVSTAGDTTGAGPLPAVEVGVREVRQP